jgi:hypothetical protein
MKIKLRLIALLSTPCFFSLTCAHGGLQTNTDREVASVPSGTSIVESVAIANSVRTYEKDGTDVYSLKSVRADTSHYVVGQGDWSKYSINEKLPHSNLQRSQLSPEQLSVRYSIKWQNVDSPPMLVRYAGETSTPQELEMALTAGTFSDWQQGKSVTFELTDAGKTMWKNSILADAQKTVVKDRLEQLQQLDRQAKLNHDEKVTSLKVEVMVSSDAMTINEPVTNVKFGIAPATAAQ